MFTNDHNPPHFHAFYGEYEALIDINGMAAFAGKLPPRVLGLVIEWTILHQPELLHDWFLSQEHQPLDKIDPLQ